MFEHPGEATFPVSALVVKRGGMVVFCAGTTGFNITFDARYVWMRQKRIQGSHFAHLKQASAANQFVIDRRIDPCMSEVFPWDKIPQAHTKMWKNQHPPGNMAVLVNAPRAGPADRRGRDRGRTAEAVRPGRRTGPRARPVRSARVRPSRAEFGDRLDVPGRACMTGLRDPDRTGSRSGPGARL